MRTINHRNFAMKREFNARPHTQGSLKNNLKPSHNGAILIWRGKISFAVWQHYQGNTELHTLGSHSASIIMCLGCIIIIWHDSNKSKWRWKHQENGGSSAQREQKWGTKRSARQCSFQWYQRQSPNSNKNLQDEIRRWWRYFLSLLGCGRRGWGLWISLFGDPLIFGEKIYLALDHWGLPLHGPHPQSSTCKHVIAWQETDLAGLNSQNFYSRHVEFLHVPHMNRNKNSGPKGLLRSLSLPTLGSFSPSFHTRTTKSSTGKQDRKDLRRIARIWYLGPTWILYKLQETTWEFCDDRSNKPCRALGVP